MKHAFLFAALVISLTTAMPQTVDPYLWLEDVTGERALAWVHEQNARTEKTFADDPRYERLRREFLAILDSHAQIPYVERMGDHYYNYWRDERNPRGIWRRVPVAEYGQPDPPWEVVLDLDLLAKSENENWVWKPPVCLRPQQRDGAYELCMLRLSRGGADAYVAREFDLRKKAFIAGGFSLPEAKSDVDWADENHLWVGTDFGAGSMTQSGYPRIAKRWSRGTPLAQAQTVFTGKLTDIAVTAFKEYQGPVRDWISRDLSVREQEYFALVDGKPVKLDLPRDVRMQVFHDWLLLRTQSAWKVAGRRFVAGSLLAIECDRFLRGARDMHVLYEPRKRSALQAVALTRSAVLITELDNVHSRISEITFDGKSWRTHRVPAPENVQLAVVTSDWDFDDYQLTVQGFTTPTTLYSGRIGMQRWEEFKAVKALPAFFDASRIVTEQFEATSRDGTRIPYFIAHHAQLETDGSHPTLLQGYGGFAISQLPNYSALLGRGWLEAGGVLVRANIRGGGEFGPQWHRTAQREGRQKTFDDFIAVAEDLIRRGISSPAHLGILGGSQGGLLVTGAMVQRPELFSAVVAQVPLTDMLRYHKLLAGASWMGEYGDPDVASDRAFIAKYSPYQNVRPGVKYPPIYLATSTRDDRVHPGHARKLAARMLEQGHDVLYFENVEGGHAAGADNEQAARMWAQSIAFLARKLGLPETR
ncbi:MAG TPA: prolyl oligopeptidase family serine peptidase [Burkholderiaceae bacterium]|nr:prolyl oligopeptidase family serine peptidase [Burkholderiaceae bacterium]